MALVYNSRLGTATRKAVALKMADCATDAGTSIWPSLDTIAYDTEISKSTVQRTIKELLALKVIEVVSEGGGRRKSTEYRFNMQRLLNLVKMTMKDTQNMVKMTTKEAINMVTDDKKHGHLSEKHGQSLTTEPLEPSKERERGAQARPRANQVSYLGEEWELPAEWRSWAAKKSPRHSHMIDGDAERFKLHYAEDSRADWERTWQKWWLRTIERAPRKVEPKPPSFKDPNWGGVTVHNSQEPFAEYEARMIREGKFRPPAPPTMHKE